MLGLIKRSEIEAHHTKLHATLTAVRAEKEELIRYVKVAAELYARPTAYRTSKGTWSMNTSIGFETRFEALVAKAEALLRRREERT